MRFSKAVAVAVLAFVSLSAHAAELFVSTSGNDANAGTLAAPFRTIGKAAGIAQPGDVVSVRAGVYNAATNISSKGTAAARIVAPVANPSSTRMMVRPTRAGAGRPSR